jgi:hypothetical protein
MVDDAATRQAARGAECGRTEHRRFRRFGFDAEAVLTTSSGCWHGKQVDVSLKGALISMPTCCGVRVGEPCRLELRLGDGSVVIRMDGDIAHVSGAGVGVSCRLLDLDSVMHLRRLVQLHLADDTARAEGPAITQRERPAPPGYLAHRF